jgi:hypothetical protein
MCGEVTAITAAAATAASAALPPRSSIDAPAWAARWLAAATAPVGAYRLSIPVAATLAFIRVRRLIYSMRVVFMRYPRPV